MNKISGILMLFVYVCLATMLLNNRFVEPYNMENNARWTAMYAIIGIGTTFVIITGGIDLSIGSVMGVVGCLLPMLLSYVKDTEAVPPSQSLALTLWLVGVELLLGGVWVWQAQRKLLASQRSRTAYWLLEAGSVTLVAGVAVTWLNLPFWVSVVCVLLWVMAFALHVGWLHGWLVTKLRLQPFVVTLCTMLIYRGFARWITGDQNKGFGTDFVTLRQLAKGKPESFATVIMVLGIGAAIAFGYRLWKLRATAVDGATPATSPSASVRHMIFGLLVGVLITIVAGSWSVEQRVLPTEPSSTVAVSPAEKTTTKSHWPAEILFWVGLAFMPCGLWLLVTILRNGGAAMVVPLVTVAACGTGLAVAILLQKLGWPYVDKVWELRLQRVSILVTLGVFMGVLRWFSRRTVQVAGEAARLPLAATAVTTLCWLMGKSTWLQTTLGPTAFGQSEIGKFLVSQSLLGRNSLAETLIGPTQVPAPVFTLVVLGAVAAVFLNLTVYGRYLLALGRNETAAKYSGIQTDRMVLSAYVICAGAAGVSGILFALDLGSIQPSGHASGYELKAIAAAVLGGCSLRGGEGSILGVVIGAAVLQVLCNAITMLGIQSELEPMIIGAVVLIGVIVDEFGKRFAERERRRMQLVATGK